MMKACVDIGGTKVAVSLNDGHDRTLIGRRTEPTAKIGDETAVAEQVLRLLTEACAAHGCPPTELTAVGISSCGPFELRGGLIELATPNICGGLEGAAPGLLNHWRTAPLEAPLRAALPGAKLVVENDAVAALIAERRWGALQGMDHCAYVTWSTGVGTGLCVDGRVLRGKNANAGHAGHSFVSDTAPHAVCGCGNDGDVEGLAAGSAIGRRFGIDAASLMAAASHGDAAAQARVAEVCRVVGRMLYNLAVTLDLQRISLGGSVFWHHRERLLPLLRAEVAGRLPALTGGVELVPAGLADAVGDYAALALVAD